MLIKYEQKKSSLNYVSLIFYIGRDFKSYHHSLVLVGQNVAVCQRLAREI